MVAYSYFLHAHLLQGLVDDSGAGEPLVKLHCLLPRLHVLNHLPEPV